MRVLAGLAVVLASSVAAAQPQAAPIVEEVRDTIEDAKRLHRSLGTIVDLAYTIASTDPDELGRLPSLIYGAFLDEIRKDPVASALLDNSLRQYRGGYARLSVIAGATSDLAMPGAVTGSADVSYDLPLCRVIGAHAHGLAGYDSGDAIAAWALGGTACLPLPANTIQISYTRRDNVRGSLLRRPVVLPDQREEHAVNALIRFWRWSGDQHEVDLSPIIIDVVATTSEETGGIGGQTGSVLVGVVDWKRRGRGLAGGDQLIRFLQVKAFFHSDETGIGGRYTSATAISPLVLDGVRLSDQVAVGLDLGFGTGGAYEADDLPAMPDPNAPPPPAIVRRNLAHFETWADFAAAPVAAQLKVGHTLMPAYGGQLILEDRASGRVELARPFVAARLEGFVGRARVVRDGDDEFATVYGGAGDVAYAIAPNVHAVGRLEIARAIAAGLDRDPVMLEREVRATIGLTAHFDRRW